MSLHEVSRKYVNASYFQVTINSDHRSSGTAEDGIYTISFPRSMAGYISGYKIQRVHITDCMYNVHADNNTFVLTETALGTATGTITPGRYTAAQFTSTLKTGLDAASVSISGTPSTYTVTYDTITKFTTIASTGGAQTEFQFTTASTFDKWTQTPLGTLSTVVSGDPTLAATGVTNMNQPANIIINMHGFNSNFSTLTNSFNSDVCMVDSDQLTSAFTDSMIYNNYMDTFLPIQHDMSSIHIRLIDCDTGKVIINNNAKWVMTLIMETRKFTHKKRPLFNVS